MAVSSNEKMQNWVKKGHVWVTWPNFVILRPPNISRTVEGVMWGHVTVEARNFKFGTETGGSEF